MPIKDKNIKCAKQKFKHNFILITYENIKWNTQGYGAKKYLN
jgi:hypothetical protein